MTAAPPGRIILLNGVGSVGKSSIARAIQEQDTASWLHVQMDAFLDMLPARYMDHPDGLQFIRLPVTPPEVEIRCGPVVDRLLGGMRDSVAALARAGNRVIVDDVLIDGDAEDYRRSLAGLSVFWVGVVAPLAVIETREQARGDRVVGLARWQYPRVHRNMTYDLEVDAGAGAPADLARQILAALPA
ncbi:MAG: chloramphenicol phosphotransferase [Hyphomicrobiales bacterium]